MDENFMGIANEDVTRGQYLTFKVYTGDYGVEISYVTEIIGVQDITPVPHTYEYVKGLINMRGTIVPIIDLRQRFGLDETQYTDRTCIILLSMDDINIGLIVEEVQEVITIEDEDIQPPPRSTDDYQSGFVKSIGIFNGSVKQLLDINILFEVESELKAG